MPFVASRTALVIACAFSCAAIATAADLREESRRAFDSYAEQATRAFLEHVRNAKSAGAGSAAGANATPRNGDVVVRPGREDGIMHTVIWILSAFAAGAVARVTMKGRNRGYLGDVALGLLGSVIGACCWRQAPILCRSPTARRRR